MIIISISIAVIFTMCAYWVLTQPGELLQHWARFVNIEIKNKTLKKLLICPYCMGGQIMFWTSVVFSIKDQTGWYFISVPVVIVFIHQFIKANES